MPMSPTMRTTLAALRCLGSDVGDVDGLGRVVGAEDEDLEGLERVLRALADRLEAEHAERAKDPP